MALRGVPDALRRVGSASEAFSGCRLSSLQRKPRVLASAGWGEVCPARGLTTSEVRKSADTSLLNHRIDERGGCAAEAQSTAMGIITALLATRLIYSLFEKLPKRLRWPRFRPPRYWWRRWERRTSRGPELHGLWMLFEEIQVGRYA